jgi:TonB family protein
MSTPEVWKAREGRLIDRKFVLQQWIGGSDHSAVFLTNQPGQPPQKAAIKLISASAVDAEQKLALWRTAAQLSHPNLIRIFDAGTCQMEGVALLYVVMELADEDLSQVLPQRALQPGEVADMLPPLLSGLSYLHDQGFVDGRLKPSNVLAAGNQLKLASDQIIRFSEGSPEKRRDVYDAPEMATGGLLPASDLWSLGVTLIVVLTQNVPTEDSQGLLTVPAKLPEPFGEIVQDCLHSDPKQRRPISDILRPLQPAPASAATDSGTRPAPPRSVRRGAITLSILFTGLVVAFLFFYLSGFHSRGGSGTPQPAANSAQSQPGAPAQGATPASSGSTPAATANSGTNSPGAVLKQVMPEVSQSARNTIRGRIRVVARVDVDSWGKVARARLTVPGPSRYFARIALNAAQRWTFSPPQVNGQPSASAWLITFRFGRQQTQVFAERARR